ncbi:UNVERIFIED_CONTAM: LytTR family two component transcriptional regulator [Acetivibrio alkalicellulosi]
MTVPVIVCIDNEKIVLDSLKKQLRVKFNTSIDIETAQNGEEALGLIRKLLYERRQIPVVVCDYLMPSMKGDLLLTKIKSLSPSSSCILLSGQTSLDTIKNIVNKGIIKKYIQKPWDVNYLLSTIESIIEKYNEETTYNTLNSVKASSQGVNNTFTDSFSHDEFEVSELEYIKSYIKRASEKINYALGTVCNNVESIKQITNKLPIKDPETENEVNKFYIETSKSLDSILNEFLLKRGFPQDSVNSKETDDKVVIYECISNLMERVSNIEKRITLSNEKIAVWKDDDMFVFNIKDIVCLTSENRFSIALTNNDKYKIKETLDSLESRLKGFNFFRCHRCYLVNINHIIKITPWIGSNSYVAKLKGLDIDVPISRSKIKEMKTILGVESQNK